MKAIFVTLAFFIFSVPFFAQSSWEYYSTDYWVQDVKVVGDYTLIGNPTGFHIIDTKTKKSKLFQSVNSELRGSFVWELLAEDDHLWIALNQGGIARYTLGENGIDGTWDQYYTPLLGDSDTLYRARNLIETEEGTLWFDGAWDGRGALSSLKDGVLSDHSDIFAQQPYDFSCHGKARMYFRDNGSPLNYVNLETQEIIQIALPASGMEVGSFTALNDELYVSLYDNLGSYIYSYGDDWKKISDTDESHYLKPAVKGENSIWLSGLPLDSTFIRISADGYSKFTIEDLATDQITPETITKILFEDAMGRIWLTTYGGDKKETIVYSILDGEVEEYDISHSPLNTYIRGADNLDFDCDGNLIIPNLTKVHVFDPDSSTVIDVLENRQFGDLEMVASDPISCRYYMAHDGHTSDPSYIYVFEENTIIDTLFLESGWIGDVLITSQGQLITSTTDGIGLYDEVSKEWNWIKDPLYNPELDRYNGIWNMKEHANGAITFGTYASLVVFHNSVWTTYDISNSPIGDQNVSTHFIDSKGHILVGYQGGIYKYDGIEWVYTPFFDPYENFISSIFEDEKGNYWLGSYGTGLLYWNGLSYEQYDIMNSAIPSNRISEILKHPITGDLWLILDRGIAVFDRDDFTYKNGIFGKTFFDAAQNTNYDPGDDVGLSNILIDVDNQGSVLTDENGNYSFYPNTESSIDIECIFPSEYEATTSTTINTEFNDEDIFDINFGLWKEIVPSDIVADLTVSPFICSSGISVWLTVENPGLESIDGKAILSLPNDIQIESTFPVADVISVNSVSWDFQELEGFEKRTFYAIIQGPSVEDILEGADDLSVDISASILYDGLVKDITKSVPFLCDYRPNDKLSNSVGPSIGNCSLIGDDLVYTIRFQNEGNSIASNVIITDSISSLLDINTIEVMSSSHDVGTQINAGNQLVFRFLNIDLPPKSEDESASHGYVKFKISPVDDLPNKSTVFNTANIYFDNNSPIPTNYTENILVEVLPDTKGDETDLPNLQVNISPNPSDGSFELTSNFKFFSYKVFDVHGRLILNDVSGNGFSIFNLQVPGIYFVIVNDDYESNVIKIIKI